MENLYTPKQDSIGKMLRKDKKDTIYYLISMIGTTIIPVFLYLTH